jgi:hypothetical protein
MRMNKHSAKDNGDYAAPDAAQEKTVLKARTASIEATHLQIVEEDQPAIATREQRDPFFPQHVPPRPSKAREVLQMISMIIPIVGACGTLFVWGAATFYVGDIEVVTDKPAGDLLVNVYNQKGQAISYHVSKFQLMPGMYHIEVCTDGKQKFPMDLDVKFHSLNKIVVKSAGLSVTSTNRTGASDQQQNTVTVPAFHIGDGNSGAPQEEKAPAATEVSQTSLGSVPASGEPATAPVAQTEKATQPELPVAATEEEAKPAQASAPQDTEDLQTGSHRRWWQVWQKKDEQN